MENALSKLGRLQGNHSPLWNNYLKRSSYQPNNNYDRKDAITATTARRSGHSEVSDELRILNADMLAFLGAKAEGEAEKELESSDQGDRLSANVRVHLWFARATDQGRRKLGLRIMMPTKCMHE